MDREKVIKGLALVREHLWYQAEQNKQYRHYFAELDSAVIDALAMLKEQEMNRLEIAHEMIADSILMYQGKEIVRCKDCRHWEIKNGEFGMCKICHSAFSSNWWFCADGEHK